MGSPIEPVPGDSVPDGPGACARGDSGPTVDPGLAAILENWVENRLTTETLARQSAVSALQWEVQELRRQFEGLVEAQAQAQDTVGQPSASDAQRNDRDDQEAFPEKRLDPVTAAPPLTAKEDALEDTLVAASGSAEALGKAGDAFTPITTHMIDSGASYTLGGTVWECNLFAFHPCVGRRVSVFSVIALSGTVLFHICFIYIVLRYMTLDPVSPQFLQELLMFRASAAHAAEDADAMTQNSVLAQICQADSKLHLAGSQTNLHTDIREYKEAGPVLMILVQLVWIMLVAKEIIDCANFAHCLLSIPWAETTRIVVAESSGDGGDEPCLVESKNTESIRLQLVVTVARVETLHRRRALGCGVFLVALRMALAVTLGFAGIEFLATTASMSDLVLNAMALGFVLDLGSMCYDVFVPRRMHTLVQNTEPLPVRPVRAYRLLHAHELGYLTMFFVVAGCLLAAELLLNKSFFWRLQQAEVILCGGHQDFVYATNAATGVAHVVRTTGVISEVESTAYAVLQAAAPPLEAAYGFDPGPKVMEAIASSSNPAARLFYLEGEAHDSREWDDALVSSALFSWAREMTIQDTLAASSFTVCSDGASGLPRIATTKRLRKMTGIPDLRGCFDQRIFHGCLEPTQTQVRAACPASCECASEDSPTYFFQHPLHGCPSACASIRNAAITANAKNKTCKDGNEGSLRQDLALYAQTLVAYARHNSNYAKQVDTTLSELRSTGTWDMTDEEAEDLLYHITMPTEPFGESIVNWSFMPGMMHPRGLVGCSFMTSYEFLGLTGIDPCAVDLGRSIRWHCPEACHCSRGMDECPFDCNVARNE